MGTYYPDAYGSPPYQSRFHATSKLIEGEAIVVQPIDWQDLGGAVTNVGYFILDPTRAMGRVTFEMKSVGVGAELRIVERDGLGGEVVLMSAPFVAPNTAGAWQIAKFMTNQPPGSGDRTYVLQGRLNGATSASVRFASISLLEMLPA